MILQNDFDLFSDLHIITVKFTKTELEQMCRDYRAVAEEEIEKAIKAYANVNGRPRKANWMWHRKKKRCCR